MSPYVAPGLRRTPRHQYFINRLNGYLAETHSIPVSELKGKSRKEAIVEARYLGMYILRKFKHMGFDEIGEVYNRDHATAIHGVKEIEKAFEMNDSKSLYITEQANEIERKLLMCKNLTV